MFARSCKPGIRHRSTTSNCLIFHLTFKQYHSDIWLHHILRVYVSLNLFSVTFVLCPSHQIGQWLFGDRLESIFTEICVKNHIFIMSLIWLHFSRPYFSNGRAVDMVVVRLSVRLSQGYYG